MRLATLTILLLFLPTWPIRSGIAQTNLVKNPGFEEGPQSWSFQSPRTGHGDQQVAITIDEQVRRSGKASARLTLDFKECAQIYCPVQTISVFPDTEYLLSAYIKTDLETGAIHLELQDARGWKLLSKGSVPISGQTDWTKVEMPFRTSFTTEAIRIGLRHVGRPSDKQPMKGQVWLDDAVLVETDLGRPRLSAKELEQAIRASRLITLENKAVKIAFSEPRLSMRSVEFKARPDLAVSPGPLPEAGLYQIRIKRSDGRSEELRSVDAQSVTNRQLAPGSYLVEAKHPGSIAKVSLYVTLDESGCVNLRLQPGRPGEGAHITEIVFPQMVTRGLLSDDPKATFVGGEKPVSLGKGWNFRGGLYPINPRIPLLYQYGPNGGVYLAVLDPDQWVKSVEMTPSLSSEQAPPTAIAWRYSVKMAAGDAIPNYTARLGPIQHTPYEAAEVYREWAAKQPWFPTPLTERKDIGSWRLRGVPHYFIYLPESGPDSLPKHPKDMSREEIQEYQKKNPRFRLSEVPTVMEALPKEITDLDGVVDLRGWEKWGLWMNPDWWPPRGGDQPLRQATEAIHKAGLHVTADVMFYSINIHRPKDQGGFGDEAMKALAARGIVMDDVTMKDERGEIVTAGEPIYRSAVVCPTSPLMFNEAVWTLTRMKEAGFDDVQFDGGGWPIVAPCWNQKHSHPLGAGYWQTQTAKDYYERIRDGIPDSRRSGFGFVEEYYNEVRAHSYIATYTRCEQLGEVVERLKNLPENRMVPQPSMFSFAYHGRAIETGFFCSWGPVAYAAAANVVFGVCAGPQPTPWLMFRHMLDEPWVRIFIAGTKARQTFAHKYLQLGRMLAPVAVRPWATIRVDTKDEATGKWKRVEPEVPAIIQQAYRSPDGKIGWVLVNHTGQGVTCIPETPWPTWFSALASSPAVRRITINGAQRIQGAALKNFAVESAEVVLLEQE